MSDIIAIAGSPSSPSRSSALLTYIQQYLEQKNISMDRITVRDLPTEDLILGRYNSPAILSANERVIQAKGVIIATPIYKTTYTGVLKTYLDLLPQASLAGKIVLPIATGGTLAHLLAIDYSLKPVLYALGSRHILQGVYIVDRQIRWQEGQAFQIDAEIEQRLQESLEELAIAITSDIHQAVLDPTQSKHHHSQPIAS
ncbi:MAG: NADPH-dependent FMN reductase [Cyanobacteriota bacterium]|nr:NADPH-dependent FMN reductase [Cyanobacteriota bacterium]